MPLPSHVAIIMDGNGRWAKARSLPRTSGHRAGVEAIRRTLEVCKQLQIPYLTLYAFSSENWKRPIAEVDDLMGLLRFYLNKELESLHKNNIRVTIIGEKARLSEDIQQAITHCETLTRNNTALHLHIALSYGSRQEITHAAKQLASDIVTGKKTLDMVTEESFASYLYAKDIPDPDLLIRTGGEQRLSNFLLWQMAYTELFFTPVLWPDFASQHLEEAVEAFKQRDRRYGTA